MSTLIFSLPLANASASTDYQQTVLSTAAAGPRDKEVWALLPAAALSWHQVSLPAGLQRNPARLTAALHGLLEEQLLEEPEQMHFALQPGKQVLWYGWPFAAKIGCKGICNNFNRSSTRCTESCLRSPPGAAPHRHGPQARAKMLGYG